MSQRGPTHAYATRLCTASAALLHALVAVLGASAVAAGRGGIISDLANTRHEASHQLEISTTSALTGEGSPDIASSQLRSLLHGCHMPECAPLSQFLLPGRISLTRNGPETHHCS